MKFFINEKIFETNDKFTILDLITYLNLLTYPIAIELNEIFIQRKEWDKFFITNLDQIEIVTIVGGG